MKKKMLGLLLPLTLAAGMLTGCGGEESSSDEKTLTLWSIATESDNMHSSYLKAIEEWEEKHEGYKIKFETFENQSYKTKIKS